MILDDFKKSQSNLERLQAEAVILDAGERRPTDTILKNAILQKSAPFGFVENSVCTQQHSSTTFAGENLVPMNVDDLAFTGVVYGFYTNEWNTEVNFMNTPIGQFDLPNMLNLFFHGSVMVDRAIANAEQRQHYCSSSDGRFDLDARSGNSIRTDGWTYADDGYRLCQGPVTSLFTLLDIASNRTSESIHFLSDVIIKTLDASFPDAFDLNATTISMEKRNLTEQIQVEALTIDVVLDASINYGLTACIDYNISCNDSPMTKQPVPDSNDTVDLSTLYFWELFSTSFCGNTSCAFYDMSNTFHLQKEVAAIPLMNCTDVQYDDNYGDWYPTGCTKSENEAVLYGIGSYISGTLSRTEEFDAQCAVSGEDGEDCTGIWYELPQSKCYLFAGKDRIPTDIMEGDFHSPTPLVQLNTPSTVDYAALIELEYLNFDNFKNTKWNASLNQALANDSCSSLMESYLHQWKENNYFLERPLEVMYTSAFFLLQNAGVTELVVSPSSSSSSDRLANVELKGDRQLRRIALSIPIQSFWISCAGCALVVVMAIAVLVFPVQNAEYFKPETSTAEKYVAMKTSANYPDIVYKKTWCQQKLPMLMHPLWTCSKRRV